MTDQKKNPRFFKEKGNYKRKFLPHFGKSKISSDFCWLWLWWSKLLNLVSHYEIIVIMCHITNFKRNYCSINLWQLHLVTKLPAYYQEISCHRNTVPGRGVNITGYLWLYPTTLINSCISEQNQIQTVDFSFSLAMEAHVIWNYDWRNIKSSFKISQALWFLFSEKKLLSLG